MNVQATEHVQWSTFSINLSCECDTDYLSLGLNCLKNVSGDPCDYVDCGPNAECVFDFIEIQCECPEGYKPADDDWGCVSDAPDPCESMDCGEHGACHEEDGKAVCVCEKGYYFKNNTCVSVDDITCYDVNCSGHGNCIDYNDEMHCSCEKGYHEQGLDCVEDGGPECTEDFDCYYECGLFQGYCIDSECECIK